MQSQKRKRYHKDNAPSDDIITLINLVRQNPVLYNYKLQPNQRRRVDVLNGWAEIAAHIGNKYTVEECRRKWKNLRDTYHQYRLRKPKYIEGRLSKWRYAKELDFLSTVYQPKLKSQRVQNFETSIQDTLLEIKPPDDSMEDDDENEIDDHGQPATNDIQHSHLLINDDSETFILTAYEANVNDVVTIIDQHQHCRTSQHQEPHRNAQHHHLHNHSSHQNDPSMPSIELTHGIDDIDDDNVIHIKHEHRPSLDEDETTVADVDYEEVCLCDESGNPTSVEIGVDGSVGTSSSTTKSSYYIDANEFCMDSITPNSTSTSSNPYVNSNSNNSLLGGTTKLKNLTLVTTSTPSVTNNRQQASTTSTHLIGTATLSALTDASDLGTSTMTTVTTTTNVGLDSLEDGTTDSYVTPTILQLPTLTSTGTNAAGVNNLNITTCGSSNSPVSATTLSAAICGQAGILQLDDTSSLHSQAESQSKRDELDLFFDFLKKKIQCFSKSEITHIQVEFLNCVLRRQGNNLNKEEN